MSLATKSVLVTEKCRFEKNFNPILRMCQLYSNAQAIRSFLSASSIIVKQISKVKVKQVFRDKDS